MGVEFPLGCRVITTNSVPVSWENLRPGMTGTVRSLPHYPYQREGCSGCWSHAVDVEMDDTGRLEPIAIVLLRRIDEDYDGDHISRWEDCVWKPKIEVVA